MPAHPPLAKDLGDLAMRSRNQSKRSRIEEDHLFVDGLHLVTAVSYRSVLQETLVSGHRQHVDYTRCGNRAWTLNVDSSPTTHPPYLI